MKIAYAGFDLLYPCLEALEAAGCEVMRVFTYPTDNVYESRTAQVTGFAEARGIPWTDARVTSADLNALCRWGREGPSSAGDTTASRWTPPCAAPDAPSGPSPSGTGPVVMPCTILRALASGVTIHKVAAGLDTGTSCSRSPFPRYGGHPGRP